MSKVAPEATASTDPDGTASAAPSFNVPALTVVPPPYKFAPERVRVPVSVVTSESPPVSPVFSITPEKVDEADPPTVSVTEVVVDELLIVPVPESPPTVSL
jgi:hypothetical protein